MPDPQSLLREQAGQLLIMGFDGTEPSEALLKRITHHQPGGIIFFTRNLTGASECYDMVLELHAAGDIPKFFCIDLEGGTVDRFKTILAPAPSAETVFKTGKRVLFEKHGDLLGSCARALGFNVDFAPVFDIGNATSKPVLASRTVSPSATKTNEYCENFLNGLQKHVLGCGKHFPGLGEGTLDSHHELPIIKKDFERLWSEDLYPYRKLQKQLPFIMVAHAAYPAVTGDRTPASLSSHWMHEVLRTKMGYHGLIISDDLEMGGVLTSGSIGEVAVATLRAGADMFLVCHKESAVEEAMDAVLSECSKDPAFHASVAEKSMRVLAQKDRSKQMFNYAKRPTAKTVAKLRRQIASFDKALLRSAK